MVGMGGMMRPTSAFMRDVVLRSSGGAVTRWGPASVGRPLLLPRARTRQVPDAELRLRVAEAERQARNFELRELGVMVSCGGRDRLRGGR